MSAPRYVPHVDLTPSLYRVGVTSLFIAALANILLWKVSRENDAFADIIAIASVVVCISILVTAFVPMAAKLREEALLVAFAMWTANAMEFWLEDGPRWYSKARQGGFYVAFALLALGTYLVQRLEITERMEEE